MCIRCGVHHDLARACIFPGTSITPDALATLLTMAVVLGRRHEREADLRAAILKDIQETFKP